MQKPHLLRVFGMAPSNRAVGPEIGEPRSCAVAERLTGRHVVNHHEISDSMPLYDLGTR